MGSHAVLHIFHFVFWKVKCNLGSNDRNILRSCTYDVTQFLLLLVWMSTINIAVVTFITMTFSIFTVLRTVTNLNVCKVQRNGSLNKFSLFFYIIKTLFEI